PSEISHSTESEFARGTRHNHFEGTGKKSLLHWTGVMRLTLLWPELLKRMSDRAVMCQLPSPGRTGTVAQMRVFALGHRESFETKHLCHTNCGSCLGQHRSSIRQRRRLQMLH